MKRRCLLSAATLALLVGAGACSPGEEGVPPEQVPKAVIAAVKAKFPDAQPKKVEKETEEGQTVYEVELLTGEGEVELLVSADGKILKMEKEEEEEEAKEEKEEGKEKEEEEENETEVSLDEVPDAVKSAALAAVKGLQLTKAEKETEDGALVYELEGTAGGEEYEVKVSTDGKVLKVEKEKDKDEEEAEEQEGEDDED